MKISIVIPAYNEEKYIGKTLESIKKLETDNNDIELLVVDGGSKDKTSEIAKSFGAKIISEPHRGIGFARQQGLKHAKGEIVIFTDADTIVPSDWLNRHIKVLKQTNVVFSYGSYRVSDGYFPYYHYTNYIQHYLVGFFYYLLKQPLAPGQNMAFWREKALSIGGFDENIRLMEDFDLAIRIKKIGRVIYQPNLIVLSSGRRSNEGWSMFFRAGKDMFRYFILGKKDLRDFPGYR